MERIKQALEKARLERQVSGGVPFTWTRTDRPNVLGPVTYAYTRTVHVSKSVMQERRIISGPEQNAFADAYKILRTQVLQRLGEKNWNSLAVTSPGVDEGKTLTAINLAISLAMEVNYTVLLVDADLRHPSVHTYFGFDAEYGLSDYLTSDKPLSELLVHPEGIPGLVILPGGKPLSNSAEMLSSPRMVQLVDELKARYQSRIIVFDLPPLLSVSDTLAFSPYVDAALLVIEDGKTGADDVKRSIDLLQGTSLLGAVLNKAWTEVGQTKAVTQKWYVRLWDSARLLFSAQKHAISRTKNK